MGGEADGVDGPVGGEEVHGARGDVGEDFGYSPRDAADSTRGIMDMESSVLAPRRREAATMLPTLASRRIVFF